MQTSRTLFLLALGAALSGCGGTVFFEGKSTINIEAMAPPAPRKLPVKLPGHAVLVGNQINIDQKVQFEINKAVIKSESFGLLDEVAGVIKQHPEIKKLEVQGHASSDGGKAANQTLSEARAKSVMDYLVQKGGVDPTHLSSKGYGDTVPLQSNDTEEGRVANRRVQFIVLEKDEAKK
jgi:outer membrane protein OmpA-like peptidoglycan-associated protein